MESPLEPSIRVALCWLAFAATHIGLTTDRVRSRLVAALGPWGFGALYSAVAVLTLALFIRTYARLQDDGAAGLALAGAAPVRAAAISLIVAGVVLAVASFASPTASVLALAIRGGLRQPRGLERVTRHSFFAAIVMLGMGHALLAQRLSGTVAFGGLALMTLVGALHQDRKLRHHLGQSYADYLATTSFVPFAAVLAGRQRLVVGEIPWIGLAAGIGVAFALRSVHDSILARDGAWVIGSVTVGAVAATASTWVARRKKPAAATRDDAHALMHR